MSISSINIHLIERFYHDMWNEFDTSVCTEILAPNISFRGSLGQEKRGIREFCEYVRFVQDHFPDFYNKIEEVVSEDTKSFAKLLYTGTQKKKYLGYFLQIERFPTLKQHYSQSRKKKLKAFGCWEIFTVL